MSYWTIRDFVEPIKKLNELGGKKYDVNEGSQHITGIGANALAVVWADYKKHHVGEKIKGVWKNTFSELVIDEKFIDEFFNQLKLYKREDGGFVKSFDLLTHFVYWHETASRWADIKPIKYPTIAKDIIINSIGESDFNPLMLDILDKELNIKISGGAVNGSLLIYKNKKLLHEQYWSMSRSNKESNKILKDFLENYLKL